MSAQYPTESTSSLPESKPHFTIKPLETEKPAKWQTIAFFLALIFVLGYFFKDRLLPQPGMITVLGEGKVQTQPQLARFTVTWLTSADNPQGVLVGEKSIYQNLINVLKSKGVNEADINVAHGQVVAPSTEGGKYQMVNALDAKLKKIDQLDQLVTDLYVNGAASVANITLSTDNEKELEEQAISKAIEDAKTKAQKTAKAAKKRLGRMISLTTDATGQVNALTSQAGATTGEGTTSFSVPAEGQAASVSLGQIEVVRNVSIVYELK